MVENSNNPVVTTVFVVLASAFAAMVWGNKKKRNLDGSETMDGSGAAETENSSRRDGSATETETETEADSGYWLNVDRDFDVVPTERKCYYCCKEGKVHPLERFACYPCCGYKLCLDCMAKSSQFCGECLTELPYGENAYLWMLERNSEPSKRVDKSLQSHLLGRIFISGSHTYLDELVQKPLYDRLPPPSQLLAVMNPPNIAMGVHHLTDAAKDGVIAAMLDLADAYDTNFQNDPFQKDKEKAEYWFRRALGQGNKIFPLAFTRYGLFLKWESRLKEARNMFEVAATYGHARAQYEYALCLLGGIGTDCADETSVSDEDVTRAIEWLCQASKNGFFIPSYILLAKTLIDIAEKAYGTACLVGKSPLPRALQILSHAKDGGYGDSQHVQMEASKLSERYGGKIRCSNSNCRAEGTENNPLMACHVCGVSAYCSKICQRRDFRDGHKFECAAPDRLFDFHMIKLTLPWVKKSGWRGEENVPSLRSTQRRTLMQMVEDDTDETYGEEELGYDEHVLTQYMLRMRKNLETYLDQKLRVNDGDLMECETRNSGDAAGDIRRNLNLKKQIDNFAKRGVPHCSVAQDLAKVMHTIREYANTMVHRLPEDPAPDQNTCEEAVRLYRQLKEEYETDAVTMHEAPCPDDKTKRCETRIAVPDKAQSSTTKSPSQARKKKRKKKGKAKEKNK